MQLQLVIRGNEVEESMIKRGECRGLEGLSVQFALWPGKKSSGRERVEICRSALNGRREASKIGRRARIPTQLLQQRGRPRAAVPGNHPGGA